MGNATNEKDADRLRDVLLDLKESSDPPTQSRSALGDIVANAKNKTKPRLTFLDENKRPVTALRRESLENDDLQDIKKLQEEFYIQLDDPSQAGKKSVVVTLFALSPDGADRSLEGIMLKETSPGKFISKPQLLINPKEKSMFDAPDYWTEALKEVKKHEVELGETIVVENENGDQKIEASVVCIPTAKLYQVSPAVLDENGKLVSTLPQQPPAVNVMTEINPAKDRVAHREMQMQFDKSLAGKKVTWTIEPLPLVEGAETSPAIFRGDLKASPNHKDFFESSKNLEASGFQRISQNAAETVIDDEGFTSVRTNLPPIAFNKAQVKMQVDGIPVPQEAANFIVPGVVVIDPGHGGKKSIPKDSSANNAVSPSGVLEKDKTLEVAKALKEELKTLAKEKNLPIQVHMTRTSDVNVKIADRTGLAKNTGADVFLSIHFNGGTNKTRGAEGYYRAAKNNNVNLSEDIQLATSVTQAVENASIEVDPTYKRQAYGGGVREDTKSQHKQLGVLNDKYLGNTKDYHPARAVLMEMDYLTNDDVDGLLKDKKLVNTWAKNMAGAIITNMVNYHQTPQATQQTKQPAPKQK